MVYKFSSTSKISFPGSGILCIHYSLHLMPTLQISLFEILRRCVFSNDRHDKLNQLRHARYFGNIHGMVQHMKKHVVNCIFSITSLTKRPKFDIVI